MTYAAAQDRYDRMPYRRCGRSGLLLPAVSLGLWHNFGARPPARRPARDPAPRLRPRRHPLRPGQQLRAAVRLGRGELRADPAAGLPPLPRRARDLQQGGLRHVARPLRRVGLAQVRARLAGPEPRRGWGSTTSTSSTRTGFDPDTPLEETLGALDTAVRQGKALYAGISSYSAERTRGGRRRSCAGSARRCSSTSRRTPCSTAGSSRTCSTSSAARASAASSSRRSPRACSPASTWTASPRARGPAGTGRCRPRAPHRGEPGARAGAERDRRARGQSLAQMAVAWVLRDPRVTSALVGASSVAQLEDNARRAGRGSTSTTTSWPRSTATRSESGINLWARSSDA